MAAGEVFDVADDATAAAKPAEGALDDPAFGEHLEAFRGVRALDDLKRNARFLLHLGGGFLTLITAIGDGPGEARMNSAGRFGERCNDITVLYIGRRHDQAKQQAERIYGDMALLPLDFFTRIKSCLINMLPPFSADLTDWLSTIASVGEGSFSACSRQAL